MDPNPYRNLGDALKQWRERLRLIQEQQKEQDQPKDKDDENAAAEGLEYEYAREDKADERQKQALGPATEEQLKQPQAVPPQKDETAEKENMDALAEGREEKERREEERRDKEEMREKKGQYLFFFWQI